MIIAGKKFLRKGSGHELNKFLESDGKKGI